MTVSSRPEAAGGGSNRTSAEPSFSAEGVFGGPLRNRLYMCASTSVYACYVDT